jgi:acyl-CoA thioesterase-2
MNLVSSSARSLVTASRPRGLLHALDLVPSGTDANVFIGPSQHLWLPPGGRAVFGGQVVGQALNAMTLTLPASDGAPRRSVHSMHAYFLAPGNPSLDLTHTVQRTRDGASFSNRSVVTRQGGKEIFSAMASFHIPESGGLSHQTPMPNGLPDPESLPTVQDRAKALLGSPSISPAARRVIEGLLHSPIPIDMRQIPSEGSNTRLWVKADLGTAGGSEGDESIHRALLALISDLQISASPLAAHGLRFPSSRVNMITSVDHTLHFHAPLRMDEWNLYSMSSPRADHGLGLSVGHIFRSDGVLAASVTQESLIRLAAKTENHHR